MTKPSPTGAVMIAAARAAGRSLARDFGEVENLQVSRKGPADFVSNADLRAEEIIYAQLSKARPGYGFLMEERGIVEGTDASHRFIVDPLDGTLNFLHGQPHYAVSIGLERDGALIAGVVYDVAKNELFWAETGRGAWIEQKKLRVAARRTLQDCVVATGTPWAGKADAAHVLFAREIAAMTPSCAGIRRNGSAALDLAWVAAGRFDAFWERGLKPWDIAAGIVIVKEAGGKSGGLNGDDVMKTGNLLSGNLDIFDLVQERLASAAL